MQHASKVCSTPGCPNIEPCDEHKRIPWKDSPRNVTSRLSGWAQQRRTQRVLARDSYICHVCGEFGADQADHVIPVAEGGRDDETNLRAIHRSPCHADKTAAEAARGRS